MILANLFVISPTLKHTFLIVGDINIDPKKHTLSNRYTSLLEEFELKQHVDFLTHILGNTLDHLITPEPSQLVKSLKISDCFSDHMVIRAVLDISKPMIPKKLSGIGNSTKLIKSNWLKTSILLNWSKILYYPLVKTYITSTTIHWSLCLISMPH